MSFSVYFIQLYGGYSDLVNLNLTLTPDEFQIVLDSLMETLIQVSADDQPAVADLINRVRVAGGLPEEKLIDDSE